MHTAREPRDDASGSTRNKLVTISQAKEALGRRRFAKLMRSGYCRAEIVDLMKE